MHTFYFKPLEVMPIGLTGIGQRSMHTNLIGKIIQGNFIVGNPLFITMKDGTTQRVFSKYLAIGRHLVNRFSEENKNDYCAIALSLHPSKAHLIDITKIVWADKTEPL